jgi:flagellar basal-body rod protein FlgF
MIDKAAYIGMDGAKSNMNKLAILTNNLANVNTTGFRADAEVVKSMNVSGNNNETRVYSTISDTFTDFKRGPVLATGRQLDIAMEGDGFIAVQSKTGKEVYTRDGSLEIDRKGFLVSKTGELVMGTGGPINLPPAEMFTIAADGTVSAKFEGSNDIVRIDKIKLVNPPTTSLQKGQDGMFYMADGAAAPADINLKIIPGALEGSNVNAIETLTQLIDISRSYEIHTNLVKTLSENASQANQIISLAGR